MISSRWMPPLAALALGAPAPATAQGVPPAQWPAEVRAHHAALVAECRQIDRGRVTLDGDFVRRVDFTGDGRPDFLVDMHSMSCSTALTLYCGSAGCAYTLFVSQADGRYRNVGGFNGDAELVIRQGRPLLRADVDGAVRFWGWNGRALTIVGAGDAGATPVAVPRPSAAQPYGFVINLIFSPPARAAVASRSRSIGLYVSYQGEPIPSRRAQADAVEGIIALGTETARLPARPGFHLVTGNGVNRARVAWVRGVMAAVDIREDYSARRDPRDYLLCDMPPVTFPEARREPVAVTCRLQRELYP
jgi:hypothetical protein